MTKEYEQLSPYYSEGLAAACRDGKWGYIDRYDNEVIPITLKYDLAVNFSEGLAQVAKKKKKEFIYGFIDSTGNEVIKPQYYEATDFINGMSIVTKRKTKITLVAILGIIAAAGEYVNANSFHAAANPNQQSSYEDQIGSEYSRKVSGALDNGIKTTFPVGIIDKTNKEIIPVKYNSIKKLTDDLYEIMLYKGLYKVGVYSITQEKEIVPVKYFGIKILEDGTLQAKCKKDNIFHYFDINGNKIDK